MDSYQMDLQAMEKFKSAICWTSLNGQPWRPVGSSVLNLLYKIHSGTVGLDKGKYLTPAPNIRRTRASHEYTRYLPIVKP